MRTASMICGIVEDELECLTVIVSVHGRESPSDAEWGQYMQAIEAAVQRRGDIARLRGLSVSAGGGPTTLQRDRMNQLLAGRSVKVAIMTHSTLVRGVVTALGWFNPAIRAFGPLRFKDAVRHLDVSARVEPLIVAEMKRAADVVRDAATMIDLILGTDVTALTRSRS